VAAENYAALEREQRPQGFTLYDLGAGLEYNYLFFNLNDDTAGRLPEIERKQTWFRDVRFRRAVSLAIDRQALVRLVYQGRATAIWGHVTPGNKLWINSALPKLPQSFDRARELLREAGFWWRGEALIDATGRPVQFTIITSASNNQRRQMATMIQDDLSKLGMRVQVVPLEFRAQIERVTQTHDYEASLLALGSGDVDPAAEMNVWLSSGGTHLWHLGETKPATSWEAEIDSLMQQQLVTLQYARRKQLYDRVQAIVAEELPIICLVSPNILVGAKDGIGNLRPSILDHYTLWNVDEIYWRK
jgi:peptide/nickel transport system substrate-binding protein